MAKKKNLFVCYALTLGDPIQNQRPVYCYAFSHCHAMNLAVRFCVDCFHWELNSFTVSEPILITSFAK